MALNGRVILICGDEHVGIVQRLIAASKELGHDVIFVDSAPSEREYMHLRDLPLMIEPPQFPKELKQPDRSRIQDRWGKYK